MHFHVPSAHRNLQKFNKAATEEITSKWSEIQKSCSSLIGALKRHKNNYEKYNKSNKHQGQKRPDQLNK